MSDVENDSMSWRHHGYLVIEPGIITEVYQYGGCYTIHHIAISLVVYE